MMGDALGVLIIIVLVVVAIVGVQISLSITAFCVTFLVCCFIFSELDGGLFGIVSWFSSGLVAYIVGW